MSKQPVTLTFSSIDSVRDLAALLDYMLPYASFAIQEYGNHSEQVEAQIKLRRYSEWVVLLRDFIRDNEY